MPCNHRRSLALSALLGVILAAMLVACGSSSNNTTTEPAASESDETCFTQLDPDQKAQLVSYVKDQGGSVDNTTNNPDGTQDVCVLEPNGNGSYSQRYYNEDDGFGDYLLYAMLFGRSNTLMTYGLISGDLDVSDYLALQVLAGVNSRGIYHPYGYTNEGWSRSSVPAYVPNATVTKVYYGNQDYGSYTQAKAKNPPKGYAPTTVKPVSDAVATVTTNPNGKSSYSTVKNASASVIAKTAKPLAPTTVKPAVVTSIANPNAASTTAKAQATTAKPAPAPTTTAKPPTATTAKAQATTAKPAPAKPKPAPAKPKPKGK